MKKPCSLSVYENYCVGAFIKKMEDNNAVGTTVCAIDVQKCTEHDRKGAHEKAEYCVTMIQPA